MRFFLTVVIATVFVSSPQQLPRDPFKEMQRRAEKEAAEKNYRELQEAAAELALLSRQINTEIEEGGKDVISIRIFDRLDRIEKLTKRIRDKAKGSGAVFPKSNEPISH